MGWMFTAKHSSPLWTGIKVYARQATASHSQSATRFDFSLQSILEHKISITLPVLVSGISAQRDVEQDDTTNRRLSTFHKEFSVNLKDCWTYKRNIKLFATVKLSCRMNKISCKSFLSLFIPQSQSIRSQISYTEYPMITLCNGCPTIRWRWMCITVEGEAVARKNTCIITKWLYRTRGKWQMRKPIMKGHSF